MVAPLRHRVMAWFIDGMISQAYSRLQELSTAISRMRFSCTDSCR